jgi:hypothetical protein
MIDKDAVRRELEQTRNAYHELLASLSDAEWNGRSRNPDMSIKQLMWHTAWAMSWMSRSIDAVREGKSMRAPGFLIEPGRKLAMWWLARGATPDAAARKYDEGHIALLQKLETLSEEDWTRSATRFGEQRTVEWYFRHPTAHFEEHAADVRAVVEGAAG